jgi:hypothetical protein
MGGRSLAEIQANMRESVSQGLDLANTALTPVIASLTNPTLIAWLRNYRDVQLPNYEAGTLSLVNIDLTALKA